MSSGATTAAYLSIGPKVYGQQNLTGCGEFFLPISVGDLCWRASYQSCGSLR